ncbi:dockerin type I domain-containing protein [Lacipirellula sp.]|uniref:dockerin type I domain-containing protein n=1 Tax=Lacipirellula sp. TaxID=2691419 RepID=UPI003D10915D
MKRSNWRLSAILWFKQQGTVALLAAAGLGATSAQSFADVVGIGDVTPSKTVDGETVPDLPQFGGAVTGGTVTVGGTGQNVGGTAAGQMTIDIPADTDPLASDNGVIGGNRFGLGLVRIVGLNSEWRVGQTLIVADQGQGFLQLVAGARLGTNGSGSGGGTDEYDLIFGNQEGAQGFATIDGFASLMVNTNISIGFKSFGDLRLTNGARLETLHTASIGTEMDLSSSKNDLGQGYVLVDGIGTRWNVGFVENGQSVSEDLDFFIGEEGRGTLEITNQGRVQVADDTYLGSENGAYGELIVTGRNSIIWTREEMFVGSAVAPTPPATIGSYGTGVVYINDNGMVRNDTSTTIARLGTINLNGGTLLTPLVTNNSGVIRGGGTVDAASVVNNGDIRNTASTINPNLRERLLFTGAVTNNDNIESIGGEMEFKGNVTNNSPNGDIYGKDAIFRFLGASGLINNSRVTLDNTIVESTVFTNNAALAVQADATSTIIGNLTLSGSSILEMDLGSDYSQLWVTGTADLGGILSLSLIPNYAPKLGDSFEILRSDTLAGSTFDAVISPGTLWNVTYPGDSVFVTYAGIAGPGVGADFNGDNIVDAADLAVWKMNYGVGLNPPPLATKAQGDANNDGKVDGADFLLIQQQYGGPPVAVPAAGGSIVGVPEPSSLVLAAAAFGLPLAARRRRK